MGLSWTGSPCLTRQPPRFYARSSMKSVNASRSARSVYVPTLPRRFWRLQPGARLLRSSQAGRSRCPLARANDVALIRRSGRELPGDSPQDPGGLSGRVCRDGGPQEGHGDYDDQRSRLGGSDQAPCGAGPGSRHLVARAGRTHQRRMEADFQGAGSAGFMEAGPMPEPIQGMAISEITLPNIEQMPVPPLRQAAERAKRRRERRGRRREARERARANAS
ncbi:hypothetical protein ACVIW0_005596 [Bradyrhizobium sp. USDA 4454]